MNQNGLQYNNTKLCKTKTLKSKNQKTETVPNYKYKRNKTQGPAINQNEI